MSTTTITPPSTERSGSGGGQLTRFSALGTRGKALLTELNLHFAGVSLLGVLVLYLGLHLLLVWQAMSAVDAGALDQAAAQAKAAEIAARPLRGLDGKLADSTQAADKFYADRLPYAYSEVAAELGALTKKAGVRLTRVQYAQSPVLSGAYALTEVRMDANVSGDYRPIVEFINAAERDKEFFLINGINLSGQQTGQVNLRIRLTTYLRAPTGDEMTAEMPIPDANAATKGGAR